MKKKNVKKTEKEKQEDAQLNIAKNGIKSPEQFTTAVGAKKQRKKQMETVTQQFITEWELLNFDDIVKWEINYLDEYDLIIFQMKDKSVKEFKRAKRIS